MSAHRVYTFSMKRSLCIFGTLLYVLDISFAQLESYVPDQDYPIYTEVPLGLSFTCDDKIPGYYADPETRCQVWHWCVPSLGGNEKYSFICAPGTVFNQRTRVCDYFYKVDCPNAPAYYSVNEDLYKDEAGNYINGKKGYTDNKYDRRRLRARKNRFDHLRRSSSRYTDKPTTDKQTDKLTDKPTDKLTDKRTDKITDDISENLVKPLRHIRKCFTNGHTNRTNI